jgi:hypothetical protein
MVWTMSGQGYHLALDDEQADWLLACNDETEVVDCASQALEGFWAAGDTTHLEGGYKDWNVLLLCLTNGTYDPRGGTYPLNRCFFGGRLLARDGSIVNMVMPGEVADVAEALGRIDRRWLRETYMQLPPNNFFERRGSWARDEEDVYELFVRLNKLRRFYRKAAQERRSVVFYTDDPLDWYFDPTAREELESGG